MFPSLSFLPTVGVANCIARRTRSSPDRRVALVRAMRARDARAMQTASTAPTTRRDRARLRVPRLYWLHEPLLYTYISCAT